MRLSGITVSAASDTPGASTTVPHRSSAPAFAIAWYRTESLMLTATVTPSTSTQSVRYPRAVSPVGGMVQSPSETSRIPSTPAVFSAASSRARTSASCARSPWSESGCGLVDISALWRPSSFSNPISSRSRRGTRIRAYSPARDSSLQRPSATA